MGRGSQALVVTVDSPVLGPRYRETRSKFTLPPGMERANLKGLKSASGAQRPSESTIFSAVQDPTVTWKEIEQALKKKAAGNLVFETDAVLKRLKSQGDLFAPVQTLKQKLPKVPGL